MCKKIFVLTMAMFLLMTLFNYGLAQDKAARFGVKVGATIALTNVEIAGMNRQARYGFVAGGLFEYWFNYRFAIQANALYCMKGAKYGIDIGIASADITWKFDYLSIPVLGKFAFGERTKFYLLIGPEFGILLSSKQKIEGQALGQQASVEDDLKDFMNSFELALSSGLGVDIPMGSMIFFVEGRGSVSLTDIFKETPSDFTIEDKAIKNLVVAFTLGLTF